MSLNSHIRFFSVQSPKGGVGKTTLALHLARQLLADYNVLFIDMDLAGTNSADVFWVMKDQECWKDKLHCVADVENIQAKSNIFVNIVSLFAEYMSGKSQVKFEVKTDVDGVMSGKNTLILHNDQVNILGSHLPPPKANMGLGRLSDGTSVLFDSLHASWFLEMLKELVLECSNAWKRAHSEKALAVIFDNAPGYSGIESALEDFLTDIGPERAKFLFVASPDFQDRKASSTAMRRVVGMYKDKQAAAKAYLSEDSLAISRLTQRQEEFFFRLVESSPDIPASCASPKPTKSKHPTCVDCNLCFYRTGRAEEENVDLLSFVQMVINKIPQDITDKKLGEALPPYESIPPDISTVIKENPLDGKQTIQFLPDLAYQFFGSCLTKSVSSQQSVTVEEEILKLERIKREYKSDFKEKVFMYFGEMKAIGTEFVTPVDVMFSLSRRIFELYGQRFHLRLGSEFNINIDNGLLLSRYSLLANNFCFDIANAQNRKHQENTKLLILNACGYLRGDVASHGLDASITRTSNFEDLLIVALALGHGNVSDVNSKTISVLYLISLIDSLANEVSGNACFDRNDIADKMLQIYSTAECQNAAKNCLRDPSPEGIENFYQAVWELRHCLLNADEDIEFAIDVLQTLEGSPHDPFIYGPALLALGRAVLAGTLSLQSGKRFLREFGKPSVDLERGIVNLAPSDFDKFKNGRFVREIEDVLTQVRGAWQL